MLCPPWVLQVQSRYNAPAGDDISKDHCLMGEKRADAKKIEKAAVLAVGNLIQPCERIDHKFNTDDKNLLIDGTLELYRSSALTKENLISLLDHR